MSGGRVRFNDGTEQRTAGPIAEGYVSADASTTVNAVNAPTVEWDSTDSWHEVETDGVEYNSEDYATVVAPRKDAVSCETGFLTSPDPQKTPDHTVTRGEMNTTRECGTGGPSAEAVASCHRELSHAGKISICCNLFDAF